MFNSKNEENLNDYEIQKVKLIEDHEKEWSVIEDKLINSSTISRRWYNTKLVDRLFEQASVSLSKAYLESIKKISLDIKLCKLDDKFKVLKK